MSIHRKDIGCNNPRLQCSACGKWKRLHGVKDGEAVQRFFGSCNFTHGDHLAGDKADVCDDCCQTECKRIFEQAATTVTEPACGKRAQIFSFKKNPATNVIDVRSVNMRTMAYIDAIGVLAHMLEQEAAACDCPDCDQARELLAKLPRRQPLPETKP